MIRALRAVLAIIFVSLTVLSAAAQPASSKTGGNSSSPSVREMIESGSFAKGVYHNGALGFTITVPVDWTISTGILRKGLSDAERAEVEKFFVDTVPSGLRPLFRASLMDGAVKVMVDGATDKTETAYTEEYKKFTLKHGGWRVIKDIAPVTLGGAEFLAFDIEYENNSVIKERFIVGKQRGVMILLIVSHSAPKSLRALNGALETVKLEK